MELVNENATTQVESNVIVCQSEMGKFNLFFGLHHRHPLYSHNENFSKSLQIKKPPLPLVNDWQTSLSHCFNHLVLTNFSNPFTMLF